MWQNTSDPDGVEPTKIINMIICQTIGHLSGQSEMRDYYAKYSSKCLIHDHIPGEKSQKKYSTPGPQSQLQVHIDQTVGHLIIAEPVVTTRHPLPGLYRTGKVGCSSDHVPPPSRWNHSFSKLSSSLLGFLSNSWKVIILTETTRPNLCGHLSWQRSDVMSVGHHHTRSQQCPMQLTKYENRKKEHILILQNISPNNNNETIYN